MNQYDQHQQYGGQGRGHGRNRGGGERGGGGGLPGQVISDALKKLTAEQLASMAEDIITRSDLECERAKDEVNIRKTDADLLHRQRRRDLAGALVKSRDDRAHTQALRGLEIAEKQANAEDERRKAESASRASRQKSVALFAQALSAFTANIPLGTLAREYRERLTTRFLSLLSREALEHFRSAVVGTAQDATDATAEQATHTLMMLARIKNDQERFQTARAVGLLPERYLREE